MIAANELMIGNYVTDEFYESFKTIIEVESINEKGINLIIEDDGNYPECAKIWIEPEYSLDKLFGIPLTEEWLLKFGFSEGFDWLSGDYTNPVNYKLAVTRNRDTPGFYISKYLEGGFVGSRVVLNDTIEYVHQIQNLYFALTGEHLTIKQ